MYVDHITRLQATRQRNVHRAVVRLRRAKKRHPVKIGCKWARPQVRDTIVVNVEIKHCKKNYAQKYAPNPNVCIFAQTFFLNNCKNMTQTVSKTPSKQNLKDLRRIVRAALQNAHDYIARECETYGISVAELCRRAGVERSHFQRWKNKVPRSMKTFDRLLAELDTVETELVGNDQPGTGDVATA